MRRRRPAAPGQEKKDTRLAFELNEARELQAASAEVLRVISTSPKNVQPVFDIIAESAVRLCQGQGSKLGRELGGMCNGWLARLPTC